LRTLLSVLTVFPGALCSLLVRVPSRPKARGGPEAAVGIDGVFERLAHPDDARSGSTFTIEGHLDAQ
jgi:hypothetical protein